MKIPKGMTQKEVIQIIQKVVKRQAAKFRFGFYDSEDMEQEAFIIAMDALDRYDGERPLENFLAVHLNNRLKNFKRDHFYRLGNEKHEAKKNLMTPIDLDSVRDEHENNMSTTDNFIADIETREMIVLIDKYLDVSYREDYLKIMHSAYVPKPRREQIYDEIRTILEEHSNETG